MGSNDVMRRFCLVYFWVGRGWGRASPKFMAGPEEVGFDRLAVGYDGQPGSRYIVIYLVLMYKYRLGVYSPAECCVFRPPRDVE